MEQQKAIEDEENADEIREFSEVRRNPPSARVDNKGVNPEEIRRRKQARASAKRQLTISINRISDALTIGESAANTVEILELQAVERNLDNVFGSFVKACNQYRDALVDEDDIEECDVYSHEAKTRYLDIKQRVSFWQSSRNKASTDGKEPPDVSSEDSISQVKSKCISKSSFSRHSSGKTLSSRSKFSLEQEQFQRASRLASLRAESSMLKQHQSLASEELRIIQLKQQLALETEMAKMEAEERVCDEFVRSFVGRCEGESPVQNVSAKPVKYPMYDESVNSRKNVVSDVVESGSVKITCTAPIPESIMKRDDIFVVENSSLPCVSTTKKTTTPYAPPQHRREDEKVSHVMSPYATAWQPDGVHMYDVPPQKSNYAHQKPKTSPQHYDPHLQIPDNRYSKYEVPLQSRDAPPQCRNDSDMLKRPASDRNSPHLQYDDVCASVEDVSPSWEPFSVKMNAKKEANVEEPPVRTHEDPSCSDGGAVFSTNTSVQNRVKAVGGGNFKCFYCEGDHMVGECVKFKSESGDLQFKFIRSKKLCDNCLSRNHFSAGCRRPAACTIPNCSIIRKHMGSIHDQVREYEIKRKEKLDAGKQSTAGQDDVVFRKPSTATNIREEDKGDQRMPHKALHDQWNQRSLPHYCNQHASDGFGRKNFRRNKQGFLDRSVECVYRVDR
eukprot:gene21281-23352_t